MVNYLTLKATALNNSVFTSEDLSHIPSMDSSESPLPSILNVVFSVYGIQHLLYTLDMNKASGPDRISLSLSIIYIYIYCAEFSEL